MQVGINGKNFNKKGGDAVIKTFALLKKNGVLVKVSPSFLQILKEKGWADTYEAYEPRQKDHNPDCMISLGGDGTMLESITHFAQFETPVLGINIGRLGYLATTAIDDLDEAIPALVNKDFEIDERALIHLETDQKIFGGLNFALNDFTIIKSDSSSMIVVNTFVDGEFLNTYWADGIIVATPTGSTGYSLSCGGPIVMPHSNNFIVTPVAPHNLTIRPLVLSGDSEIRFEIIGRSQQALISLDSRSTTVPKGAKLMIRKEKFNARLIKIKGYSNFETLRQKLNWGLDPRNWADFDIAAE